MNQVNQSAHKDASSFIKSVEIMLEVFGEVAANVAPAFGGGMREIRSKQDLENLKAFFDLHPTPTA